MMGRQDRDQTNLFLRVLARCDAGNVGAGPVEVGDKNPAHAFVRGSQHRRRMSLSQCTNYQWRTAALGHLRRINGADGVSGSHLIAPQSTRRSNSGPGQLQPCGRDKKATHIIATLIDVHAKNHARRLSITFPADRFGNMARPSRAA